MRWRLLLHALVLHALAAVVRGQQTQQNFTPAWLPMTVRSPQLNAWLWHTSDSYNDWPRFGLDAGKVLAWCQFAKVDGELYQFFGNFSTGDWNMTSTRLTPTRTIIDVQLGSAVRLTTTFLSPIEPDDLVLQSMPFAYITTKAISTDGKPHQVVLYSDVTGEWVSGVIEEPISWYTNQTATFTYHRVQREHPQPFSENADVAEDATLYYGIKASQSPPMSYRMDAEDSARDKFVKDTNLGNKATAWFRPIAERWPVAAFAYDLGSVQDESDEVVWAIGLARDQIVRLGHELEDQVRYPLYLSRYNSMDDAFSAFLQDYDQASPRADDFDTKIMNAATSKSAEYADLVALGTRQALAGLDITVSKGSDGSMNASDVQAFIKDSGNSPHVNHVQVMFSVWPTLLYINPSLAGYLLKSTLRYAGTDSYSADFAPQDLGFAYPAANGGTPSPQATLGVEGKYIHCHSLSRSITTRIASGSFLIMAHIQAAISGDGALIYDHYDTLKSWADYLVQNALNPGEDQYTADGLSASNNSNLALKGIMGLQAMSEISKALHEDDDAAEYAANATYQIGRWTELAVVDNHVALNYSDPASSGVMFSMYADKLLKTGLVPDNVYDLQTSFYGEQLGSQQSTYGIPYSNTDSNKGRADLLLLTAATTSDTRTRDALIRSVWNRATNNTLDGCFPYGYNLDTGMMNSGTANPAQGAVFSLLALDLEQRSITIPERRASGVSHAARNRIIGGVVGGVGGLMSLLSAVALFRARQRKRSFQVEDHPALDGTPSRVSSLLPHPWYSVGSVGGSPQKARNHAATGDRESASAPSSSPGQKTQADQPLAAVVLSSDERPANQESSAQPVASASSERHTSDTTGDTTLMRNELDSLRREVAEIRQQRVYDDVPPPEYSQGGIS
ncbi:hypothetical protein HDZ31DRAFT_32617 [Schizophyllum fasciatum]